jgi:hypothetical protein
MEARLDTIPEIARLKAEVKRGSRVVSVAGLTSISSKAYVLAQVQAATGKHFVVVTQTNEELEAWECDLDFWMRSIDVRGEGSAAIVALPSFDTDVYS